MNWIGSEIVIWLIVIYLYHCDFQLWVRNVHTWIMSCWWLCRNISIYILHIGSIVITIYIFRSFQPCFHLSGPISHKPCKILFSNLTPLFLTLPTKIQPINIKCDFLQRSSRNLNFFKNNFLRLYNGAAVSLCSQLTVVFWLAYIHVLPFTCKE